MDLNNLELVPFNDPLLRKAPELFDFDKHDAKEVCDALFAKQIELNGAGLSANQVGLDMKVFTFGDGKELTRYIINPEIIGVSEKTVLSKEGCLSLPGLWLHIRRPISVTVDYYSTEGEKVTETFTELAATVFLHEFDHMLGQNFTMRVSKLKLDRALKALKKNKVKQARQIVAAQGGI